MASKELASLARPCDLAGYAIGSSKMSRDLTLPLAGI